MTHRAPSQWRSLAVLALGMTLLLATPALAQDPNEVARPSEAQLQAQLKTFREMRKAMLLDKANKRLAMGARNAKLAAKADKGNAKAMAKVRGAIRKKPAMNPALEAGDSPSAASRVWGVANPPLAAQSLPSNVRANNPAGDGASAGQSEEDVAALGDNVLAAWNDGQGFVAAGNGQGVGYSTDGGATWTDAGNPPVPAGYPAWEWTSDPVIAVNEKTGTFYYCGLADATASTNAIGVAIGSFVGNAFVWSGASVVRELGNATNFLDKQWLVADSLSGNLYITHTNFDAAGNSIDFNRSTDGGLTWQPAIQLSSALDDGYVQGSRPAVGPNGEVYAVWSAIDQVTADDNMRFRQSGTSGASFLAEITASKYLTNFGTGAPGFNRERGISFPSITVDRTTGSQRGRIYLAWNESLNHQDENFAGVGSKSEVESNNTAATASPAVVGNTLRGTLSNSSDVDYFAVPMVAGQSIALWADSLRSTIAYTLRVLAPIPQDAQRLAFGMDMSASAPALQAFLLFTAPVAGTYFVRMAGLSGSPTNAGYRIRMVQANNTGERGRDQRDAFVTSSTNGVVWTAPARVNDDAVGFDNWLPEVEVGGDGYPYVKWYDHRDDTYGSRAHQYITRSTNAGAAWATNQRFSNFQSNFTTGPTNIAPNMGDYNSLGASTTRLHATWADTRDADINVYTASIPTDHDIAACQADVVLMPNQSTTFEWMLENRHILYANDYTISYTSERNWPLGPQGTNIAAETSSLWQQGFTVPDTAAAGTNQICLNMTNGTGATVRSCCFTVTVQGAVGVGNGTTAFALRGASPNPALGRANLSFTLAQTAEVDLAVYNLQGALVRHVLRGTLSAGSHNVAWDGLDENGLRARAGTYFVRLASGGEKATSRFVFLR